MIKLQTMVGAIATGMVTVHSGDKTFLNITDQQHATKVQQIVEKGIYYGYIKAMIDGDTLFEHYHLQIIGAQWLRYIELFELFLKEGFVQADIPTFLEMKRIDADTLSFQIRDALFVFSYREFMDQFILAALEYFTLHEQMANDGIYEDVITHLQQWQAKFYVTE